MKAREYVYIHAWCEISGASERRRQVQQEKAVAERAPADALYCGSEGHWVTVRDISNTRIVREIDLYVASLVAVCASEVQ